MRLRHLRTCYREGYDAYYNDIEPGDCPYRHHPSDLDELSRSRIWSRGWLRAFCFDPRNDTCDDDTEYLSTAGDQHHTDDHEC